MGDIHFYQRPWFCLIFPPILIVILYFFTAPQDLDYDAHIKGIIEDIAIYFGLLVIWLAFFSQFILPVQTFRDRQKIFDRLIAYLTGTHGPAIFIRDGQPVQRDREESKQGRGVLWLDSASGVVTRTDAAFKNTFGPGVHFTEKGEKIVDIVDLHIQTHNNIGPMASDDPFAQKTDQQTVEEYDSIQKRRALTSGLTRDGIEVIPNINVLFKIDADPIAEPNLPGSRFGFNTNAVRLAITGQAINPNMPRDSYRYHVRWNELPSLLASDVWRDLLSKFTLKDLFEQKYARPPSFSNPSWLAISDHDVDDSMKDQNKFDFLTGIFRRLNWKISDLADRIDNYCQPKEKVQPERVKEKKVDVPKEKKMTGLEVIGFLIKERLQKQQTAVLDQFGNYQPGQRNRSPEYGFLQGRGIRVLSVGVSNLRLPSEVDLKLIRQWTANWLERARAERERLDQEEGFNRIEGEENALRDYVFQLSKDLLLQVNRNRATDLRGTLRALMLETRAVLVNETQLYRQSSPEREALEEAIQWLETRDL